MSILARKLSLNSNNTGKEKFNDTQLIYFGQFVIFVSIIVMRIPLNILFSLIDLIIIAIGCASIYPYIIDTTPEHFGARNSQAMIELQMASAYIGTCLMPPIFGLIANNISVSLFLRIKLPLSHEKFRY